MIAFSPNFLLINCTLRREAVIEFILTVSLYCFIEWYRKNKFIFLVESILLSMLAAAFHSGCIAATLGYTLFYMLYDKNKNKLNFKFKNLLIGIVIIILFFILNNYLNGILSSKFQINSMENYILRMENGEGGAGYSLKSVATGNTILDLIINSPLRIAYYLISPFPWQWRGIKDIIAFLFSSLYYLIGNILAIHLINNKKTSKHSKNLIIALFFTLCISYIIFSWGVHNSGTALRHRDKFISIYIVMSVLCIEQKNVKEKYKL